MNLVKFADKFRLFVAAHGIDPIIGPSQNPLQTANCMHLHFSWSVEQLRCNSYPKWSSSAYSPQGGVLSPRWRGETLHAGTQILISFLPNLQASTDREPGPKNARAIPCVAKRMVLCT
jgi:hypothetical protein